MTTTAMTIAEYQALVDALQARLTAERTAAVAREQALHEEIAVLKGYISVRSGAKKGNTPSWNNEARRP
jgi:hypothetical protein